MIVERIVVIKNTFPDLDGLFVSQIIFYSADEQLSEFKKLDSLDSLDIQEIIAHKNSCCMTIPEDVVLEI